jgi:hypothetical protein
VAKKASDFDSRKALDDLKRKQELAAEDALKSAFTEGTQKPKNSPWPKVVIVIVVLYLLAIWLGRR